tara:strand:- start:52075 stop:53733 length:1659 start_codon:yes stop_codon:yes gene_type:complete
MSKQKKYSLKRLLSEYDFRSDPEGLSSLENDDLRDKLDQLGFKDLPKRTKLSRIEPGVTKFDIKDLKSMAKNGVSRSRSKIGKLKKSGNHVFSDSDLNSLETFKNQFADFSASTGSSSRSTPARSGKSGKRTHAVIKIGKEAFYLPKQGNLIGISPSWDGTSVNKNTGKTDTKLRDDLQSFSNMVYSFVGNKGATGDLFEDLAQNVFDAINVNLVPTGGGNAPDAMFADGLIGGNQFYSVKGSLTQNHGVDSSPVFLGPLLGLCIKKQRASGVLVGCISGQIVGDFASTRRFTIKKTGTVPCIWEEIPVINDEKIPDEYKGAKFYAVRLGGKGWMIWADKGTEFIPAAQIFGSKFDAAASITSHQKDMFFTKLSHTIAKKTFGAAAVRKYKRKEASMSADYGITIAQKSPCFMSAAMSATFGGYTDSVEFRLLPPVDSSRPDLRQMADASSYDSNLRDEDYKTSEFADEKERDIAVASSVEHRRFLDSLSQMDPKDQRLIKRVQKALASGKIDKTELLNLFPEHIVYSAQLLVLEQDRHNRFMEWAITGKKK